MQTNSGHPMAVARVASQPYLDLYDQKAYINEDADFYGEIKDYLNKHGQRFAVHNNAIRNDLILTNFLMAGTGNQEMADSWSPVRALGQGAFGRVGLWQKLDPKTGKASDIIVIKEMESADRQLGTSLDPQSFIPKEPFIMDQLQTRERNRPGWRHGRNILRLRAFKHYPRSKTRSSRLYLEYAPYGDLTSMFFTYRRWKTFLPESFLWHIFHGLANAIDVMARGDFNLVGSRQPAPPHFQFVHLDIKPENIFLAKPYPSSAMNTYPAIKLADFGHTQLTGPDHPANPSNMYWFGTLTYQPPEQTTFTMDWDRRPQGQKFGKYVKNLSLARRKELEFDAATPSFKFGPQNDVWSVGRVMHVMTKLCFSDTLEEDMMATTEDAYWGELNEAPFQEVTTAKNPEYSKELRELIKECLHIDISKRPDPASLAARITKIVEEKTKTGGTQERVWYRGHEINRMPVGDAHIPWAQDEVALYDAESYADERWEPLRGGAAERDALKRDMANRTSPIGSMGPKVKPQDLRVTVTVGPKGVNRRVSRIPHKRPQPPAVDTNSAAVSPRAEDAGGSQGGPSKRRKTQSGAGQVTTPQVALPKYLTKGTQTDAVDDDQDEIVVTGGAPATGPAPVASGVVGQGTANVRPPRQRVKPANRGKRTRKVSLPKSPAVGTNIGGHNMRKRPGRVAR